MKKVISLIIIFLSFINVPVLSANTSQKINLPNCNKAISKDRFISFDKQIIKKIEIDINNHRKWTVNGVRILTGNFRFVPSKYKKRFNAKVSVSYEDDLKCFFEASVRHSGDQKDHISIQGNNIIQSVDVHLINGNINGITKFKLLRPKTRGNLEDEIFLTELLRNLNYLAPRSMVLDARINKSNSFMLFQEKAAKELLEFNNRREGPILEGDERFFFTRVEEIPDNQISNWSMGIVPLMNKSAKSMLSKQVNSQIINKSINHEKMSYNAITNLNLIYLHFSNSFQNKKNNFHYFEYDLDNNLLAFLNPEKTLRLDIYKLLMIATNSHHGLAHSNRKFYWNSIEGYYEPINYDSNPDFNAKHGPIRHPITSQFEKTFNDLEKKLNNIDLKKIKKNLEISGVKFKEKNLKNKINKIISNISSVRKNFKNEDVENTDYKSLYAKETKLLKIFKESLSETHPGIYLVKHKNEEGYLEKCKISENSCNEISLSKNEYEDLLEGELVISGEEYQYLGKNINIKNIIDYKNFNLKKYGNAKIYYDNNTEVELDTNLKSLNIKQKKLGARIYIIGGFLKDLKIEFQGFQNKLTEGQPSNYPIDINGLTGCLSLINLEVENISIKANQSTCEDAVNLVNVRGTVNTISIEDSFQDGLDIDFSNISVENINIKNSYNDCLDLSSGNYKLKNLFLSNCGDKALSVGEKSFLKTNIINVDNSNIGIASKDSSVSFIEEGYLENTKTCISAYNKKQEFNGGLLEVKKLECKNYSVKNNLDNYSKILVNNEF